MNAYIYCTECKRKTWHRVFWNEQAPGTGRRFGRCTGDKTERSGYMGAEVAETSETCGSERRVYEVTPLGLQ